MVAVKRKSEDDDERELAMRTRKLRQGLLRAFDGGYDAALAYCRQAEDGYAALALAELARVASYEKLESLIGHIKESMLAAPATGLTLRALGRAIEAVADRASADCFLQAQAACLLLSIPAVKSLRLAGDATVAASPAPCAKADSPSAGPPTEQQDRHRAVLSGDLSNLASYVACVNEVASVSGVSFPHCEAALALVKSGVEDEPHKTEYLRYKTTPSVVGSARASTELVLLALVRAQGQLRRLVQAAGPTADADIKELSAVLASAVSGLSQTLDATGAEYAVAEGMREFAWADWREKGFPALLPEAAAAGGEEEATASATPSPSPSPVPSPSPSPSPSPVPTEGGGGAANGEAASPAPTEGEGAKEERVVATVCDGAVNKVKLPKKAKFPMGDEAGTMPTAGFLRGVVPDDRKELQPVTPEGFFGVAAMHLHEDSGIDEEFMVSRNPLYLWRASRLMLGSHEHRISARKGWCTEAVDFESALKQHWPDLGQQTMDKLYA